jgi:hypothetical protein
VDAWQRAGEVANLGGVQAEREHVAVGERGQGAQRSVVRGAQRDRLVGDRVSIEDVGEVARDKAAERVADQPQPCVRVALRVSAPCRKVRFGAARELAGGRGDRQPPVIGERQQRVGMGEDVASQRAQQRAVRVKAAQPGDQRGRLEQPARLHAVAGCVLQPPEQHATDEPHREQPWRQSPDQTAVGVCELAAHQAGNEDDGVRAS